MGGAEFVPVMRVEMVPEGRAVAIAIGGCSILVCNSRGNLHAIENKCTHAEAPLERGLIRNGWIACPAHGARFDLETGAALNPPAEKPVGTFATRVVDGTIEVAVRAKEC
ncbi:MAG: Rieske 2Fe-2S domain-containing protein [Novosphingobium sp.]|nr:Rieske 2Fe-2S domain-containing protein [Novosphingobium sp.]